MLRNARIDRHRNLGVIAHIDAGKTTVTERILFYAGAIHAPGEVHHGDTATDFLPEERLMGITITAAATSFTWSPRSGAGARAEHHLELVDTPGHVDFSIEVERSLRVLDGAVVVLDAVHGVEPQSEAVWRQADRHDIPRLVFVNKMDKPGADFAACLASMRERLGVAPLPVQLPLGEEGAHRGVIDLVRLTAIAFPETARGAAPENVPIPAELLPGALAARAALVEACADADDAILAKLVDGHGDDVTEAEIERALRRLTLARRAVVVLCGSALRNKGVQPLLDAICAYLPSPADRPPVSGHGPGGAAEVRPPHAEAPLCALAFKTMAMERLGWVTFLRVYSGCARPGMTVLDATTGQRERLGRLALMNADRAADVDAAPAGSIVAAIGLRQARTGDTLADVDHPLVLAGLEVPEPVVELSIEPRTPGDSARLASALERLRREDPSIQVAGDEETGQTLLRGMGELHLAVAVARLAREHRVEARTGKPRVAYRETITRPAVAEVRFVKQTGGPGHYAHVVLEIRPTSAGEGFRFEDATTGGAVPRELVPAVEKGVRAALTRGVLAGFPVVDVAVRLLGGSAHVTDSRPASFEIAGSLAARRAMEDAGPRLLEPVMAVEITVPTELVGAVLSDVQARRGDVRGVDERSGAKVVHASVPLRALFGHAGDLRSRTQGRAVATARLSHYAPAPRDVEAEVCGNALRR